MSKKQAAQIQGEIGVPVGLAVGILKDGKGVVELGFPLASTLAAPRAD